MELTLAIELICLLPVVAVDVGGGIDVTGIPRNCSRNGRMKTDCGPDMLNCPFVICA